LNLAAGKPSHVLISAFLSLLSNVVISVPLALTLGFIGPALGTVLAFMPTVWIYCALIARAYGARLDQTFPGAAFLRVLAIAAVPAAVMWLLRPLVPGPAAFRFLLDAIMVALGFSLLGTLTGVIQRSDWKFAIDWASLRVLRREA
jgi:hypothetical protein